MPGVSLDLRPGFLLLFVKPQHQLRLGNAKRFRFIRQRIFLPYLIYVPTRAHLDREAAKRIRGRYPSNLIFLPKTA